MHFGFAQPFVGMVAVILAIPIFIHPWWLGFICLAVVLAMKGLSDRWIRGRVDHLIARWAESRGFHDVERLPRGGFISWGGTLIDTAEMFLYRTFDEQGRERRITASYRSDPLGLRLRTLAEVDDDTGGTAAIYPPNAAERAGD